MFSCHFTPDESYSYTALTMGFISIVLLKIFNPG